VTVTVVEAVTFAVLTEKFADVAPAATEQVAGGITDFELDFSVTTTLAAGVAFNVTVPAAFEPPFTELGLMVSETTWNGLTVTEVVCTTPLYLAVITTVWGAVTT
jgi:hypothetical protein